MPVMEENIPWTSVSLHMTAERSLTAEYNVLTSGQTLATAAYALADKQVNKVVVSQAEATLILYPDGRYSLISARASIVTSDDRSKVVRVVP